MKATLKIDPNAEEKFKAALGKIARMASKDLLRIMQEQMVLLLKDAMKLTPPFGDAPIMEKLENQRTIGEIAIRRDLRGGKNAQWSDAKSGIFRPIADDIFTKARIGPSTVTFFTSKDGISYGVDSSQFRQDVSMSDMADFHKSNRGKNGRTKGMGRGKATMTWHGTNTLVVKKSTFDQYLESILGMVLLAKSGWVYAWQKFQIALGRTKGGGFTKGGKEKEIYGVGVPSILRSMRGAKEGHYVNSGTEASPVIEGGNVIPYVQRFYDHVVKRAWSNRVRNIQLQAKRMEKEIAAGMRQEGMNANA